MQTIFDFRSRLYTLFLDMYSNSENVNNVCNAINNTLDTELALVYDEKPYTAKDVNSDVYEVCLRGKVNDTKYTLWIKRNLLKDIRECNSNIMVMSMGIYNVDEIPVGHANMIIIDKLNKRIANYEPYGAIDHNIITVANDCMNAFTNIINAIDDPTSNYTYTLDACTRIGLQIKEDKCQITRKDWETGYCTTWSFLFMYLMIDDNMIDAVDGYDTYTDYFEEYVHSLIIQKHKIYDNNSDAYNCELNTLIKLFNAYMNSYIDNIYTKAFNDNDVDTLKYIYTYGDSLCTIYSIYIVLNNHNIEKIRLLLDAGTNISNETLQKYYEVLEELKEDKIKYNDLKSLEKRFVNKNKLNKIISIK